MKKLLLLLVFMTLMSCTPESSNMTAKSVNTTIVNDTIVPPVKTVPPTVPYTRDMLVTSEGPNPIITITPLGKASKVYHINSLKITLTTGDIIDVTIGDTVDDPKNPNSTITHGVISIDDAGNEVIHRKPDFATYTLP